MNVMRDDRELRNWDVAAQKQIGSLAGPQQAKVEHLTFDPTGIWLAASKSDGRVRIWEFANRAGGPMPRRRTSRIHQPTGLG